MTETPTERNKRIFEEATAVGEPVFVIRAKDQHAMQAIEAYGEIACPEKAGPFWDAIWDVRGDVRLWQLTHPEQVKRPDVRT